MRLAFTADLHWGIRPAGDAATRLMLQFLKAEPPDVVVLVGDIGAGDEYAPCLVQFATLPNNKALVPGNHDIWAVDADHRGDSQQLYQEYLPRLSDANGFTYLDSGPLILPDANLAIVGSIN